MFPHSAPPPPAFTHTQIIMPLRVVRPTWVLTLPCKLLSRDMHGALQTLDFVSNRPRDDHPLLIDAAPRRHWLQMNREEKSQNVMSDDVDLKSKNANKFSSLFSAHPVALMVCPRACTVLPCFPRNSLMTQPPVSCLSLLSDHYTQAS